MGSVCVRSFVARKLNEAFADRRMFTHSQIAVMNWTLANIPGVCEQEQANFFTCPNGRTFFSSSIGKSS
jgi:hypothetical protein